MGDATRQFASLLAASLLLACSLKFAPNVSTLIETKRFA